MTHKTARDRDDVLTGEREARAAAEEAREALRQSEERLLLALDAANMTAWEWDVATGRVVRSGNALGLPTSAGVLGPDAQRFVHPEDRPGLRAAVVQALEGNGVLDEEYRVVGADGAVRWIASKGRATRDAAGRAVRLNGVSMDVTGRKRTEQVLAVLAAQHAAVVDLGQRALAGMPLAALMDEAARIVARTLDVEYVAVLEVLPDEALVLRAGVGYGPWLIGRPVVPPGVVSSTGVTIAGRTAPFGELRVHSTRPRTFAENDGDFLRAIANVLGAAAIRERAEEERDASLVREQAARGEAEAAANALQRVQAVTDVAMAHLGLDELLGSLLVPVRDMFAADASAVLLVTEDGRQLEVRAALGLESEGEATVVPIGRGIAGRIAATREPLIVNDTSQVEVVRPVLRERVCSLIGVPLLVRDRLLGAIHVGRAARRPFGHADLALLKLAADRIALAIDNALLYAEAQRARAEAESANRMKDEFLAILSHELRSPLSAIVTWSRVLHSSLDEANVGRALDAIERNARVQAKLVADLLDVSRIVSGKLVIEPARVDLGAAVQAAVEVARDAATAKGLALEATAEAVAVRGDPTRLQQIFGNLLANAIKFTPEGGRITVGVRRVGAEAEVTVSDTGIGIPRDVLPYVFDRFRQGDSTTTRRYGGLGLGLAIARHLVEAHGGTIAAESGDELPGSVFRVRLPVDQTGEGAGAAVPELLPPRSPTRASLSGLSVLVVDDEEDARRVVATVLAQSGAEVVTTCSAREALRRFADRRPDVLVTDLAMPEVDGYALLRTLRSLEGGAGRRVPAIALTALASAEDRRRVEAAGFELHLTKPVEPDEIVAAVAEVAHPPRRATE
jgi:PAS domain S-box-containing protein